MQAIFFKDFNYLFWEGGAEKEGERESFFFFLRERERVLGRCPIEYGALQGAQSQDPLIMS